MGVLTYFCAGADINCLPTQPVSALLLNTLEHGASPSKLKKALQMIVKAKSMQVMLDSSGFQIHEGQRFGKSMTFDPNLPMKNSKKQLNIAPAHVMQTAAALNPTIVVGLDFPIRKVTGEVAREIEFQEKRKFNVRWAYESRALKNIYVPAAQYFQPIQCYNLKHLDIFLDDIHDIAFDGVSMPVRKVKPHELAPFLVSFYQRGISKVHLLGTSNFENIAICAYAARHMFDWVSLDSQSWRFAADKASYIVPWDLSRRDLGSRANPPTELVTSCPCPFCKGSTLAAIQAIVPHKDKVPLIREHNWWALDKAFTDFYANAADLVQLERFMRSRSHKTKMIDNLYRVIMLMDTLKDADISALQLMLSPAPAKRRRTQTRKKTVRV
jgi:tRNA-guanine family transglycosylase